MQCMIIVNKNDTNYAGLKHLAANAGWTVIHDDDMPNGWVAYVDSASGEVVVQNMWSKDKTLWPVT